MVFDGLYGDGPFHFVGGYRQSVTDNMMLDMVDLGVQPGGFSVTPHHNVYVQQTDQGHMRVRWMNMSGAGTVQFRLDTLTPEKLSELERLFSGIKHRRLSYLGKHYQTDSLKWTVDYDKPLVNRFVMNVTCECQLPEKLGTPGFGGNLYPLVRFTQTGEILQAAVLPHGLLILTVRGHVYLQQGFGDPQYVGHTTASTFKVIPQDQDTSLVLFNHPNHVDVWTLSGATREGSHTLNVSGKYQVSGNHLQVWTETAGVWKITEHDVFGRYSRTPVEYGSLTLPIGSHLIHKNGTVLVYGSTAHDSINDSTFTMLTLQENTTVLDFEKHGNQVHVVTSDSLLQKHLLLSDKLSSALETHKTASGAPEQGGFVGGYPYHIQNAGLWILDSDMVFFARDVRQVLQDNTGTLVVTRYGIYRSYA